LRRKTSFAAPQFRPPAKMKFERLTFVRGVQQYLLDELGKLVPDFERFKIT
jgi:hypothetical protein